MKSPSANPSSLDTLRHFLDVDLLDTPTLREILALGNHFKTLEAADPKSKPLQDKTLVMIFEKPSTRTRVSFQVGMQQLGGMAVVMDETDTQLGRGETIADTARVLSRYADAIMIRTDDPAKLAELSTHATVPVINGLTDRSHPCQLMADVMTFEQHRGTIEGRTVAWSGDGNNMLTSWIQAAARFKFRLQVACPTELSPSTEALEWARTEGADITVSNVPEDAVTGADLVITDSWVSMGDKDVGKRHNLLAPFRVDERLMAKAKGDALFMHCLPVHRNEEVTDGVIDGPQSVVWDEDENRLHAQKGILTWCIGSSNSAGRTSW